MDTAFMEPLAQGELLAGVRNRIGHIVLNRPKALNALNRPMLEAMGATLRGWASDRMVNAVVVRGAGDRAFCAGGDIKALYNAAKETGAVPLDFFVTEYPVNHLIANYPKPYIALLDGITMGGGMGISQSAWVRIVTDRARLAMPETAIGLIPDVGGSHFLSRMKGEMGTYLGLTGITVNAWDSLTVGLADTYLASAHVERLDAALDAVEWQGDPRAQVHATLRGVMDTPTLQSTLPALQGAIDRHFAADTVRAIVGSLREERDPELAQWAADTVALLEKRSPMSLALTLRLLRLGREQSLAECLRMELDVVANCFTHGDIMEGVRATVVDKDMAPKWNPASLEALDPARVDAFFERQWPHGHPLAGLR